MGIEHICIVQEFYIKVGPFRERSDLFLMQYKCYTINMTIFIGADHRGYQLKDKIISYIQDKNIRVEDLGNYEYDPHDDFPDYAQKVAQAVLQNPTDHLGIVICGSGAGVSIAANRFKGIYSVVGLNSEHVADSRRDDHINVLALAANFTSEEEAEKIVDAYLGAKPAHAEKYLRRLKKVDSI